MADGEFVGHRDTGMDLDRLLADPARVLADQLLGRRHGARRLGRFVGFDGAWHLGVLPFVLSDLAKVALATAICYLFANHSRGA